MAGGAAKRSSTEDGAFVADGKKKKKFSKGKGDVDVIKEKTSTACNGDLRQKKAFFAYFGKSFDDNKTNAKGVDTAKVKKKDNDDDAVRVNNGTAKTNHLKSAIDNDDGPMSIEKNVQKVVDKKCSDMSMSSATPNMCFLERNLNLPYVSTFVENLGCFPKVTHANWLAPSNLCDLKLPMIEEKLHEDENNIAKNSMLPLQSLNSVSEKLVLEPYEMEIDFRFMISSLKKSIPNFPVSDFHKHMKKKKSANENESMWIDKYKPMCNEEVLGNNKLIKNLKNWMEPKKKNSKKTNKGHYDDDDDYFINDSDSDSSRKVPHNLAILLGPSGCGKTSAVYAVANELNANVIELNASCNRNGKRIITDLMEATQSHAVEKNCLLNMLKGKNKKTKSSKNKEDANKKMTIILIEDADIFFDNYDDGFLSAISTLAADSKRPLILTVNDPFSNHLLKFFLSNEMTLYFIPPPKKNLGCFLQLMALNEGVIMSENEINNFVHPIKPDIRQSILQLQYIISTGEINSKVANNIHKRCINSLWWNWPQVTGCDSNNSKENKQAEDNMNVQTISQHLDTLLNLNLIYSKTQNYSFLDPQPFWHHLAIRDSSSLNENYHWSDNSIQLSKDITQWIHDQFSSRDLVSENLYPTSEELSRRQRMWNTSKDVLEQIGLDYCNRKNETCLDYLATVRSIGRIQQLNEPSGNLRHSKMFSYLRRINIEVDDADLKYLSDSLRSDSNCDQPVVVSDQF